MLAPAVIRAAELLAVLLAAGTVVLAAGLWRLRRRTRSLKLPGRAAASPVGAPTGDSVGQCRRLRAAAEGAVRRPPLSRQAAAEIRDPTGAAGQIQDAAAAAAMARPAARHLAEDAHREAQALAAGIAAAGLAGDRR